MRWLDRLIEALAVMGVAAFGAAAAVTVADIVGRQFGHAINGVVDLVQLFVTAGAWFVIPWAFVAGAHVGVDFVVDQMPPLSRRVLAILAALLAGGVLVLMFRYGYDTFARRSMMGDRSQQLGIPIAWYWWPLLAGQAAAILAVLSVIVHLVRGRTHEKSQ